MKTTENTVHEPVVENERTFASTGELSAEAVALDGEFYGLGDLTPVISGSAAHDSRGEGTPPTSNHAEASFGAVHPLKIKHYETISYGCLREWARSF